MKAAIGLQFNWIFVLIAGMLLFGIFFVQTQTAGKQAKFEATLTIRESLQSALANPTDNSYRKIEIPTTTIRNNCEDNSNLYLGEAYLPIQTSFYGLHAPKKMTSGTYHLQITDGVNSLTSERNVYVFVDSGFQELRDVYDSFQGKKVWTTATGQEEYPVEGSSLDYTIIYYYPNFGPASPPPVIGSANNINKEYTMVVISPGQISNHLHFFTNYDIQRTPFATKTSQYYTKGDIIGGIIDGDAELNNCIIKQELRREKAKLEILRVRTRLLADPLDPGLCRTLLLTAYDEIVDTLVLFDAEEINRVSLNSKLEKITEYNSDLLRNNCAVII